MTQGHCQGAPRLHSTGINTTTHTHRWGRVAVPCWPQGSLPTARPSSRAHVSAPTMCWSHCPERAPVIHTGDPPQLLNSPHVAQARGHAPGITPYPQGPPSCSKHTLPLPQAGGGRRPPSGTTKSQRRLSPGIWFMDNSTALSQELGPTVQTMGPGTSLRMAGRY